MRCVHASCFECILFGSGEKAMGKSQCEYIVFVFSVEDGKLMTAPEGEVQEEMEPVKGEKMTFVGYAPDGREFRFAFERDEKGKISKCKVSVPAMGIEAWGDKIKD